MQGDNMRVIVHSHLEGVTIRMLDDREVTLPNWLIAVTQTEIGRFYWLGKPDKSKIEYFIGDKCGWIALVLIAFSETAVILLTVVELDTHTCGGLRCTKDMMIRQYELEGHQKTGGKMLAIRKEHAPNQARHLYCPFQIPNLLQLLLYINTGLTGLWTNWPVPYESIGRHTLC